MFTHNRVKISPKPRKTVVTPLSRSKRTHRIMRMTHALNVQHTGMRLRYVYAHRMTFAQMLIRRVHAAARHAGKHLPAGRALRYQHTFMSVRVLFVPERLLVVFI